MTDLSIQNNNISNLSGIHSLESLTFLNASSNRLSDRLSDLSALSSLNVLDLRDNSISTFTQLEPLKRLYNLKRLYLRSSSNSNCNTVCEEDDFKQRILEYLTQLVSLDGEMIAFMKIDQDVALEKICKKDDLVALSESKIEPWFSSEDLSLPASTHDEKLVLETETKILEELRLSAEILKRSSKVVAGSSNSSTNRKKNQTSVRSSKKKLASENRRNKKRNNAR